MKRPVLQLQSQKNNDTPISDTLKLTPLLPPPKMYHATLNFSGYDFVKGGWVKWEIKGK